VPSRCRRAEGPAAMFAQVRPGFGSGRPLVTSRFIYAPAGGGGHAATGWGSGRVLAHDLNRIPVPPRRPPAA